MIRYVDPLAVTNTNAIISNTFSYDSAMPTTTSGHKTYETGNQILHVAEDVVAR